MKVIATIAGIRELVAEARRSAATVGLVPTMGALHEGHAALIRRARAETRCVVATIFVNPTQFNQAEDFAKYPRTLDADVVYCEALGVDAVFAPDSGEMYPAELLTCVEVSKVSAGLCGAFRPGHFRGVATVVAKLFNIVQADRAYFGEKDAQQLAVIRRMVADLNFPLQVVPVATVRESDGLALSSRNGRLSAEDRKLAPTLYRALQAGIARAADGPAAMQEAASRVLHQVPKIRVEYLEVVNAETLQTLDGAGSPALIAAAIWLGDVRLIDNIRN
jgi:pantoate--beta-alanine ligase